MLKPVLTALTGKRGSNGPPGTQIDHLFTIPLNALRYVVNEPNSFLVSHTRYSDAAADILRKTGHKVVLLIRDPRDQVVSLAHYIKKPQHRFSTQPIEKRLYLLTKDETLEDIITELIAGGPHKYQEQCLQFPVQNIKEVYNCRLDWLQYEKTLPLRFEDLIGKQGGGSREMQICTLKQLAEFLDFLLDETVLNSIVSSMYGSSPTFRPGSKIGRWKDVFTQEHKRNVWRSFD